MLELSIDVIFMENTEMWNKCPPENDLQSLKQIKLSTLQSYMDIDHIFTAYKRALWVIAIRGHLYIWIRCSKGASIKINMNKKKDNKPVNGPPPWCNGCLIKETSGFI